jgi:hypothetical protein
MCRTPLNAEMLRKAAKNNVHGIRTDLSHRTQSAAPRKPSSVPHRLPPLKKAPGSAQVIGANKLNPAIGGRSQLATPKSAPAKRPSTQASVCHDSPDSGYDDKMCSSSLDDEEELDEQKGKNRGVLKPSDVEYLTAYERRLLYFERHVFGEMGRNKRLAHSLADLKARFNRLPVIREEMCIHPQLAEL